VKIQGLTPKAYSNQWGSDPVYDKPPQQRGDGYLFYNFEIETEEQRAIMIGAIDRAMETVRLRPKDFTPEDLDGLAALRRYVHEIATPDPLEEDEDGCPHYKAPGHDACTNCDPDEDPHWGVCPNCEQWQRPPHGDCLNECAKRGFATVAPAPGELDRLRALIILSPTVRQTLATYAARGEYAGTMDSAWECMTRAAFTEDGRLLVRFTFGEIEALLDAAHASMTTSKLGSLWCATITARPAITDLSMIAIALPWPKPLHCPAIDDGLWSTVVGHESLETAILMALANLKTFQDANPGIFERAKVTL
jgi:hypothetical protein